MSDLEGLLKLVEQLRAQGCKASAQIALVIPIEPLEGEGPPPRKKATAKTVQWALNRMIGAAGQRNRDLVRKFLYYRGWIGPLGEPENWDLDHVPTSLAELSTLVSELTQWELDQKKPAATEEPSSDLV